MIAISRAEGGKGIMEEFLEEQGVTTYTMTEDHKGQQFLTNNDTGEVTKVKAKTEIFESGQIKKLTF